MQCRSFPKQTLYLYIEAPPNNLLAPYCVSACWANSATRPKVQEVVKDFSNNPKINEGIKLVEKVQSTFSSAQMLVYTTAINSSTLDLFSPEIAINRAVLQTRLKIQQQLSAEVKEWSLILSSSDPKFNRQACFKLNQPDSDHPESMIALYYAKALRWNTLRSYYDRYGDLLALKHHWGKPSSLHLEKLSRLKLLPPFYIRSLSVKAFTKYKAQYPRTLIPPWYSLYLDDVC